MTTPIIQAVATVRNNVTLHEEITRQLVEKKLVAPSNAEKVAEIIGKGMPRNIKYEYKNDIEFLDITMQHHIDAYFLQVLRPLVMSHHNNLQTGRLLKDTDLEVAAIEITQLVLGELGEDYLTQLFRYFGDRVGVTRHVYSRTHASLLKVAIEHNERFLKFIKKRERTRQSGAIPGDLSSLYKSPVTGLTPGEELILQKK